jgi:hypothetical protein
MCGVHQEQCDLVFVAQVASRDVLFAAGEVIEWQHLRVENFEEAFWSTVVLKLRSTVLSLRNYKGSHLAE